MANPKRKPQAQAFRVDSDLENQTLAAALRRWLTDQSWKRVRRAIESRQVTIDGNLCVDAGRRLKAGEVVKLLPHSVARPPDETDIRVQYLDEHLIVVEKPAGMTSNRHREEQAWPARRKQIQPTLDEMLPHVITKLEGRRGHRGVPPPVRAVHRLDRDTSGLMVFARTHAAERALAEQFRRHTTQRRYLAIVEGEVKAGTISTRLVRDRGDGRRGSTDQPDVGKLATTHVKPLETTGVYTLVQCRLETGRTHQIRIHLSEQGHPVCGEKVYREPRSGKGTADSSGAPRLALHAAQLGFLHPATGQALRFQAPLPPELRDFWERLKGGNPDRR